jgi:hypothetical protein
MLKLKTRPVGIGKQLLETICGCPNGTGQSFGRMLAHIYMGTRQDIPDKGSPHFRS